MAREGAYRLRQHPWSGSLADAWPFLGRLSAEQTWRLLSDLMQALGAGGGNQGGGTYRSTDGRTWQ